MQRAEDKTSPERSSTARSGTAAIAVAQQQPHTSLAGPHSCQLALSEKLSTSLHARYHIHHQSQMWESILP